MRQVDELRREQEAERVVSIRVSVGEFAGVEPELFRDAYDMMVEETPLRGAELQLRSVPLRACCDACGCEFAVTRFRFECPECHRREVTIVSGQKLVLESISIEEPDPDPPRLGVRP